MYIFNTAQTQHQVHVHRLLWLGICVAFVFIGLINVTFAQLGTPTTESIYGGRINAISVIAYGTDTSRVYITTESANSAFYANVDHSVYPPVFGQFHVLPDLDQSAGYGSGIQSIAADAGSGYLFFIYNTGLMKVNPSAGSLSMVAAGNISSLLVYDSYLFYVSGVQLHWGSIDPSDGSFTEATVDGSPATLPAGGPYSLFLHPVNSQIYIHQAGNTPAMYASSDVYTGLSNLTTFAPIGTTGLNTSYNWATFGIAPDGRLFLGTTTGTAKIIAYSDDEVNWTSVATGISGVMGPNFDFAGTASSYMSYAATIGSSDGGLTWSSMPLGGTFETHPNDGRVAVDPNDSAVVYMTTDQGIGASYNSAFDIFEIDDGVEAVQVNDFDMDSTKNYAWVASKAGVRSLVNYTTSPTWSSAMFPNGDGSPYYSTDMDISDTTGATAYVGNVRVYKTTNRGSNWSQVFTAENAPYNFSQWDTRVASIEVNQFKPSQVFAGYNMDDSLAGGLFYSDSSGALGTWNQILVDASSTGFDVDVNDILVVQEGADTVVYIGVTYDLSFPGGWSVYRITRSGATWSAVQDMSGSKTSTGSSIVVTIRDLTTNIAGDTIYAVGTDAGTNHPVAYYKAVGGLWTVMPLTGFPMFSNQQGRAVTVGNDSVYIAIGSDIYAIPEGGSSWLVGYSYPVGTQINVLYFDDLLVGTSTGLFGHEVIPGPPSTFSVERGWNLVSLPMDVVDRKTTNVFPVASSLAYAFKNVGGYDDEDTLEYGVGYWLKFSGPMGIYMPGTSRNTDTVDIKTGWNLIGTISGAVPVGSITSSPSGILTSEFFGYNHGYLTADALEQGKGYWVKANQDGEIFLNSTLLTKVNSFERNYDGLSSFVITDAKGSKQTLYFGEQRAGTSVSSIAKSELPPTPPQGVFDARFGSNKFVEFTSDYTANEMPITISSAVYPVTLKWNLKNTASTELIVDGKNLTLHGSGSTSITNTTTQLLLKVNPMEQLSIPTKYSLQQNYPNPFNPSTVIRYSIPATGFVSLKIFDVLGREVTTLVNEQLNAGSYQIEWNASALTSGVYYYRLKAGSFSETKKLLLTK